jgi:hypothetical protein
MRIKRLSLWRGIPKVTFAAFEVKLMEVYENVEKNNSAIGYGITVSRPGLRK